MSTQDKKPRDPFEAYKEYVKKLDQRDEMVPKKAQESMPTKG